MTLFDPSSDEPHAHARRTDPTTSHEAARSVRELRYSQSDVLALFEIHSGFDSTALRLTDEAMISRARQRGILQSDSGLRTRRSELVTAGLLRDSGARALTRSGRRSILWERT